MLGVVCALAAGGGAFAAAAPGWPSRDFAEAGSPAPTTPGLAVPVVAPAELAVSPADGAKQVDPAAPVSLKVTNGRIDRVALTSDDGDTVDGTLGTDGSAWTSSGDLTFNTRYNFTYSVVDDAGRETHSTRAFTTVSTANEADAAIYPLDGMKVGVAQPLQITFSEPVLNRTAVEKAIKITSTSGQVGDFHWFSKNTVRYRPEAFWAANSTITMDMKLFGVELGNGQVGNFNKTGNGPHRGQEGGRRRCQGPYVLGQHQRQAGRTLAGDHGRHPVPLGPGLPRVHGEAPRGAHGCLHYRAQTGGPGLLRPARRQLRHAPDAQRGIHPPGHESAMPYIGKTNLSHGCIGWARTARSGCSTT